MKKLFVLAAIAIAVAACAPKEQKVLVRAVPERADDFVFENDLVAGRFYGKALEGNPTSPGIDVWVKLPGKLVANDWYRHAVEEDADYYHHDHGGKDCYKVAVSLGAGASAPYYDGYLHYPQTNYRSSEVLKETAEEAVFVLHYPEWEENGVKIALDKKVIVRAGTYFCEVEDIYTGNFDEMTIAAGMWLHDMETGVEAALQLPDRVAIWEHASDQSIEPEDGMLGIAVVMPEAEEMLILEGERDHAILTKTIKPGEPVRYSFGSCWSKGNVKDSESWFEIVKGK